MADRHVMVTEATFLHGWMIQCPDCSHRAFLYLGREYEVIDRGDFYARHTWSNNPELSIGASVVVSDG